MLDRPGFESLYAVNATANNNHYATSSEEFYPDYFWRILGYPFNFVGEYERGRIAEKPEVCDMPAFPAKDSVKMIDGTLVIRLGNSAK